MTYGPNPFAGVNNADVTQAGNRNPFLAVGNHVVRIEQCILKDTREKGLAAIVEFKLLATDNPSLHVGMTHAWFQKMQGEMGVINVKKFVAATYGINPNAPEANGITQEHCAGVYTSPGTADGKVMQVVCVETTTKAGNPFTIHQWQPFSEELAAQYPE